jgi:hypothetical protein
MLTGKLPFAAISASRFLAFVKRHCPTDHIRWPWFGSVPTAVAADSSRTPDDARHPQSRDF